MYLLNDHCSHIIKHIIIPNILKDKFLDIFSINVSEK